MANITIRQSRPEDAESIAAQIKTINTPDEIRREIAYWAEKRAEGGYDHLVAIDGDAVVGNVAIIPSRYFPTGQPHRAELADIVVALSHRGTGLLRRLLAAAAERAAEMGCTQLETSAALSNERAVRAYAGVGFEEWGRLHNAVKHPDGTYEGLVFFLKEL